MSAKTTIGCLQYLLLLSRNEPRFALDVIPRPMASKFVDARHTRVTLGITLLWWCALCIAFSTIVHTSTDVLPRCPGTGSQKLPTSTSLCGIFLPSSAAFKNHCLHTQIPRDAKEINRQIRRNRTGCDVGQRRYVDRRDQFGEAMLIKQVRML